MNKLRNKLIYTLICTFTLTLLTTILSSKQINIKASGAVGRTFEDIFIDPFAAQNMAANLGKAPTDVITQEDIDNTIGISFFSDNITSISGIEFFTNAEQFYVFSSSLTSLPDSIGNLTNLKFFHLNAPNIKALPNSIGNLTNLSNFTIFNSAITSLPESFGNLQNLEYISIQYSELTSLPNSLGNLSNLSNLVIFNSKIKTLPDSIGNLEKLNSLLLFNNQLETLPQSIGNLKSLYNIDVSYNHIRSFPNSIIDLLQNADFRIMAWGQTISAPYAVWSNPLQVNNFIPNFNGTSSIIENISNSGSSSNNVIEWTNLEKIPQSLSYDFKYELFDYRFSYAGTVTQDVILKQITDISTLTFDSIPDYTYNQSSIKPSVNIKHDSYTLVEGTDYTLSYSNNINSGTATVTVTGIGNYMNSKDITFKINKDTVKVVSLPVDINAVLGEKLSTITLLGGIFASNTSDTIVDGIYTFINLNELIENDRNYEVIFTPYNSNYLPLIFTTNINLQFIDINSLEFSKVDDVIYTGENITPTIEIKNEIDNYTLIQGRDYNIEYANNLNAGTAKIILTGNREYNGTKEIDFQIKKATPTINVLPSINDVYSMDPLYSSLLFGGNVTGTPIDGNLKGTFTFENSNILAMENTPYNIIFMPENNNYNFASSFIFVNVKPLPVNIDSLTISPIPDYTYNEKSIKPSVNIKHDSYTLVEGTDYTLSYSNNINSGTATVTVTGIGNYTNSKDITFKINKDTVKAVNLPFDTNAVLGEKLSTVTLTGGTFRSNTSDNIVNGIYTFINPNELIKNDGNYDVLFTPNNSNYIPLVFKVNINLHYIDINSLEISKVDDVIYTGENITPTIEIKNGNYTLIQGRDYNIEYANNLNAGTAKIILTGTKEYNGTKEINFEIKKATPTINVLPSINDVYSMDPLYSSLLFGGNVTGTPIDGNLKGTFTFENSNILAMENTPYNIIFMPENNNYNFASSFIFVNVKPLPVNIDSLTISPISDYIYTGIEVLPTVEIKNENYVLVEETDYTCTYKDNINVGTSTITISGINNYQGNVDVTFNINKMVPTIDTLPLASDVNLNDTLSSSILTGGIINGLLFDMNISGTFTFKDPTQIVTKNDFYDVIFTPDNTNYESIAMAIPVNIKTLTDNNNNNNNNNKTTTDNNDNTILNTDTNNSFVSKTIQPTKLPQTGNDFVFLLSILSFIFILTGFNLNFLKNI